MDDPKQKTPSFVDIVEEIVEEIDVLEEKEVEEAEEDAFSEEQPQESITIDIETPVSDGALLLLDLCLSYSTSDLRWLSRQLQQEIKDREGQGPLGGIQQGD